MNNSLRTESFKKNIVLEETLLEINSLLKPVEYKCVQRLSKPKLPVILIIGNPRSGTTLLNQWLAKTQLFGYPSNIVSRFYDAPYIGAYLHKIFIDFDDNTELFSDKSLIYESKLGKTHGPSAPHEFWYFWKRFFKFKEIQKLTDKELATIDVKTLMKELAGLEEVFKKPLLFKAVMLNWHIPYLCSILEKPLFLFVKRNELYTMHSLYKARKEFFGSVEQWYSFKNPEYVWLRQKDVYEQLAGQIVFTNRYIEQDLSDMSSGKRIDIEYEKFCQNPKYYYELIKEVLADLGYILEDQNVLMSKFQVNNIISDDSFDVARAETALQKMRERAGV